MNLYKKNNATFLIAVTSMLAAVGYILKVVAQIVTLPNFSLRLSDIPIMFSGIIMGPILGGIVGFITDILYMLTFGYGYSLFTVTSVMWGLLPGIYFLLIKYTRINYRIVYLVIVVLITSIVCFSINSIAITILTSEKEMYASLPYRIITLVVKWPIQIVSLHLLYKRLDKYVQKIKLDI